MVRRIPDIYQAVALTYPEHIAKIYIRDVRKSRRSKVKQMASALKNSGVDMVFFSRIMEINPMKESLRTSRYPNRTSEDKELIYNILDEALFCTVAYADSQVAHQIPTGFCRLGDEVFIHGSVKSHLSLKLLESDEVSLSVMLFDASVLAPTAFNHSDQLPFSSTLLQSEEVRDEADDADVQAALISTFPDGWVICLNPSRRNLALPQCWHYL